jgi:hypothetical protein
MDTIDHNGSKHCEDELVERGLVLYFVACWPLDILVVVLAESEAGSADDRVLAVVEYTQLAVAVFDTQQVVLASAVDWHTPAVAD